MKPVAAPVAGKGGPPGPAPPDGSADSPVTAVLGSDPVGPGIADQAVPFQPPARCQKTSRQKTERPPRPTLRGARGQLGRCRPRSRVFAPAVLAGRALKSRL